MTAEVRTPRRRLPAGRRADLAAFVAASGQVTVADLAEQFGVSIDTVRRDLDQLDRDGVVVRTHGGAVSSGDLPRNDRDLEVRMRLQLEEKETIARLAAGLVQDGTVVMLNAGTTALAVARALREHRELTVATNNLLLPRELSSKVYRDLYVFGGSVRPITQGTTGPVKFAMDTTGNDVEIRADLALISVGAVDTDGYSTSNLGDAAMMTEMMTHSTSTAILADSSKHDRRFFAQVAIISQANYFISDSAPQGALARSLEEAGVHVLTP